MNRNKGTYQKEKVQNEIEKHTEEGCNPNNIKDFDGYENTSSHVHDKELEEAVDKVFEYGDVSEIFTRKEVKEKIVREIDINQEEFSDELINKVAYEMDRDAQNLSRNRNRENK
jgi:hypothetical protein